MYSPGRVARSLPKTPCGRFAMDRFPFVLPSNASVPRPSSFSSAVSLWSASECSPHHGRTSWPPVLRSPRAPGHEPAAGLLQAPDHRACHLQPARIRPIQHTRRLALARPGPAGHSRSTLETHRRTVAGSTRRAGGLCWIPVHQRHPWRIVRPRLTLQGAGLGRTQLKAGANLLHMPEPKGERVVLRTTDIAQQRRGRRLRGQGIQNWWRGGPAALTGRPAATWGGPVPTSVEGGCGGPRSPRS
ncbi:hypothetical protein SMICM17S_04044 [Streptomyces microflavus]